MQLSKQIVAYSIRSELATNHIMGKFAFKTLDISKSYNLKPNFSVSSPSDY
jgi:hypothetical protein